MAKELVELLKQSTWSFGSPHSRPAECEHHSHESGSGHGWLLGEAARSPNMRKIGSRGLK
jgi:hypothetical protein